MEEIIRAIRRVSFFSGLGEEQHAAMMKVATIRHRRRSQTLFLQGDPISYVYGVCAGAVQTFHETPDGHELTCYIVNSGEMLLDPAWVVRQPTHSLHARAIGETTLLAVSAEWVRACVESDDKTAAQLLSLLARQLLYTRVESEHQATMNASQIIACFLQHICATHHANPHGFDLPYTKSLIASRLGMELESLSRAMSKLKEHGITVQGKHISFDKLDAAQHYSCGFCSMAEECDIRRKVTHAYAQQYHSSQL